MTRDSPVNPFNGQMWSASMDTIQYLSNERPNSAELVALYASVGWTSYTADPERLSQAIHDSHFVITAREGKDLVGLARCISDGATIAYIQDILVAPMAQRKGVGRTLAQACLDRYASLRQVVLLTDDRPEQLQFYASLGFTNTRELIQTPLNAFVRFKDLELT